ncbi:XRE family transcriptional regulator [Stakelama sp. CBK3Z-3]|uniref:XRE family transcriptional regulator n=1 Tax=Stakelama flava TaxID=2860338 RepID=A0ABS6XPL5_9SPHN|nr:XRE family transcriptional regulator [Stakelama flava]MBW4332152.1 XRE family transcriptional regulator [Stakelama flava]
MTKVTTPNDPAATLRSVRQAKGMTLRELAGRTDIPYSTLSKLENGKMTLTYDKMIRLALGLEVDVADLVNGKKPSEESPGILGRRSVSHSGQWLDAVTERYSHHYPAADLLQKLMVPIIIDVKARSIKEVGGLVKHAGEEYLYVISGAMELHSSMYSPLALDAGDSVYFDSGMAHAYVRTSETPCRVLAVCAGKGSQSLAESARRGEGHEETKSD